MKLSKTHPAYVLLYAAISSSVFTIAIMSLHAATRGTVERNEQLFEQKALVELFEKPLGMDVATMTGDQIAAAYQQHIQRGKMISDDLTGESFELVEALTIGEDGSEELIGYAFAISGIGFWARIDGWLAVTGDREEIIGLVFVKHSETPGLGGRITEKKWRDSFAGLSAAQPLDGNKFIHIGASGPADRRIDAVTGATGTSKAVERFINDSLLRFQRATSAAKLGQSLGLQRKN